MTAETISEEGDAGPDFEPGKEKALVRVPERTETYRQTQSYPPISQA